MVNARWFRALGVGLPIATALVLFGVFGEVNSILFNTGIKLSVLFGILQGILAYLVYKNHI